MRGVDRQDGSPLRPAFVLDGLAIAAFVAAVVVIGSRGPQETTDKGFFADPLPASLMVLAFAAVIAAGAVAAVALALRPPRTRPGRWALGLAIAFVVSFPIMLREASTARCGFTWPEPGRTRGPRC